MITAADALRNIVWRRRTAALNRLTELGDDEIDAVTTALRRLPPDAQVNVGRLVDEARREAAARAASRPPPNALGILRYGLSLMSMTELVTLRDELRAKVDAGGGGEPYYRSTPAPFALLPKQAAGVDDVQPDELDDETDDAEEQQEAAPA